MNNFTLAVKLDCQIMELHHNSQEKQQQNFKHCCLCVYKQKPAQSSLIEMYSEMVRNNGLDTEYCFTKPFMRLI
jgi:hypothetical protein